VTDEGTAVNRAAASRRPHVPVRMSQWPLLAHDVPHPIGDPDDDEGGLVDDDEDDEEDDDEDDEEPMQVRAWMRHRSTRPVFLL
jgi:hypothetical protein